LIQKVNLGDLNFLNCNLDSGVVARAGQYKLADRTYGQLARRIAHNHFALTTPALKANILNYFASGPAQDSLRPREWRGTTTALIELKAQPVKSRTLEQRPQPSN
jgi:hypothetical protein